MSLNFKFKTQKNYIKTIRINRHIRQIILDSTVYFTKKRNLRKAPGHMKMCLKYSHRFFIFSSFSRSSLLLSRSWFRLSCLSCTVFCREKMLQCHLLFETSDPDSGRPVTFSCSSFSLIWMKPRCSLPPKWSARRRSLSWRPR